MSENKRARERGVDPKTVHELLIPIPVWVCLFRNEYRRQVAWKEMSQDTPRAVKKLRIRLFIYITQKNPVLVATARFSSEVIFSNETCLICAMYFMDFSYRSVDTQPSDPQKSLKSGLLLAVLVLDPAYLKYVLCIKHNRTRRYVSRKHFPVLSCLYRRNLDWESLTFP